MSIKKKIVILVSVCLIILVGAIIADRIMSKTYFNETTYDQIIKKIENDETFIFLLSQTTCGHCSNYKPKLEQVANDYKIEILYVEIDLLSDEESNKLKSYVNFDSTPTTVFIKNGEETTAASRINGDASIEKIEKKLKSNGFVD